jgi:hypothetical protein
MPGVDSPAPPTAAITDVHLDVYDTRDGPWNPDHGDLEIPDDWEFLPTGDAFVTRTVKAAGRYWLSWQPRSRHRAHRRLLGLWAPAEAIRAAEGRAEQTAGKRAAARTVNARSRARGEQRHQERLHQAVLAFLDFAPEHAELADLIAIETAAHAAVVGSGRVGRTQLLSLEDRARLAARAHTRHRYTRYENELGDVPFEAWGEDELYRGIKGAGHEAVETTSSITTGRPYHCWATPRATATTTVPCTATARATVRGKRGEYRAVPVVEGLRPPAIDELGLIGAITQAVDRLATDGGPATTMSAPDTMPPLPAAVEVAAYRIAVEAVTNAVRHTHALHCHITITATGRELSLTIDDDGAGLSPTSWPGTDCPSCGNARKRSAAGSTCAAEATGPGRRCTRACPSALCPARKTCQWKRFTHDPSARRRRSPDLP